MLELGFAVYTETVSFTEFRYILNEKAFVCIVSAAGRNCKGEVIHLSRIGNPFFLIPVKGLKIGQK